MIQTLTTRLPAPLRALAYDAAENSIMQTITIAVSAILIASGLVTAPGLVNNARDNNAKTDLANVAYAQEFYLADTGGYAASLADIRVRYAGNATTVVRSETGPVLTMSGGVLFAMTVASDGSQYLMAATSESGTTFYRSSGSARTSSDISDIDDHGLDVPVPEAEDPDAGGPSGPSPLTACVADAPAAPASGTQVGYFTTTASVAVCDSTGTLYAGTSDGVSQQDVTGVPHYISMPTGSPVAVVVNISMTETLTGGAFPVWRVNGLRLNDGMGNIVPLDCAPSAVLGENDTFTATCTTEYTATLDNGAFFALEYVIDQGTDAGNLTNPVLGQFGLQGVGVYAHP